MKERLAINFVRKNIMKVSCIVQLSSLIFFSLRGNDISRTLNLRYLKKIVLLLPDVKIFNFIEDVEKCCYFEVIPFSYINSNVFMMEKEQKHVDSH